MLLYSAMAALAKVVEFSEHMVRKTPFFGHFILKTRHLPRQARDKHGKI
jgi:hypothetical protein